MPFSVPPPKARDLLLVRLVIRKCCPCLPHKWFKMLQLYVTYLLRLISPYYLPSLRSFVIAYNII